MLDSLKGTWYGQTANAFQRTYIDMLERGAYAEMYRHIRQIRQVLEEYLPKLVNLASKCEQLPEQLNYDLYCAPWNTFSENITYNYGYLYFDEDYVNQINIVCDEIYDKNRSAKLVLDNIMQECEGLIDFTEEKKMNDEIYRKINRIQNFRQAYNEFAAEIRKLDDEIAECFQYITANCMVDDLPQSTTRTAVIPQTITKVEEIPPESGWNAMVEAFMDTWMGEATTTASVLASQMLSQAFVYKTAIDMKCRNLTLEESIQESEEFAKGYVQSVPKVLGETAEGMLNIPSAIKELPDTISEIWKLIDEYGIKTVADGILEATEESIKKVLTEDVVNGTARSRGEVTGRTVIAVAEVVLSVKGLKDWLAKKGKSSTGLKSGPVTINPNEIRFSQSSVNGSVEIVESMKRNGWAGDPIDVVQMPDGV